MVSAVPEEAGASAGQARAVLVGVDLGPGSSFDPTLDELGLLAESAGDCVVAKVLAKRKSPDPALFVGSGKADEIKLLVQAHGAHGVIFDQALSPAQQRNLERHLGVPVSDRTALILEIFAARAQSHEGKLQVDRRMIGDRIKQVKLRLEKVKRQRGTQRRARERSGTFRVSLVGYTNAGKSTLFNALVKARAYAANQLFATLDTTTRSLYLGEAGRSVSLSDTVGFIRDLPHKLVEAFRATLQEAADADLLLHVIDASSPLLHEQQIEVERVLEEIGAESVPQILVYNKLDAIEAGQRPRVLRDELELGAGRRVPRVFVSALTGEGLDVLRQIIAEHAAPIPDQEDAGTVHLLPDGSPAGAPRPPADYH